MINANNAKLKKIVCGAIASAMMLSMVGCSSESDKKSKKGKNDAELVTEAAEDFTDALADMNFKKLVKFSTDLSDSTTDDAENLYKKNSKVGDAMLKTVKFTIDEDSAEEDEDSGSIVVTYQYVDVQDLNPESLDDFIDQIESTDEVKKGKITIKFEIEDDEALVSNANKAVDQFYGDIFTSAMKEADLASDSILTDANGNIVLDLDLDDFWIEDTFLEDNGFSYYMMTEEFSYSRDEEIVCVITALGEKAEEPRSATIKLMDFDYNVIWTSKITLNGTKDEKFSIKPSDLGLKAFEPDWYEVEITLDDYDFSFSTFAIVNDDFSSGANNVINDKDDVVVDDNSIGDDTTTSTPDKTDSVVTDNSDAKPSSDTTNNSNPYDYTKTTSDKLGDMDGNIYKNKYFGFSLDVGEDLIVFDQSMIDMMGEAPNGFTYDEVVISENDSRSVIIAVADIDTSKSSSSDFVLEVKPGSGDSKAIYGEFNFIKDSTGTIFITAKEESVLMISFASDEVNEEYIEEVMNSIKAI